MFQKSLKVLPIISPLIDYSDEELDSIESELTGDSFSGADAAQVARNILEKKFSLHLDNVKEREEEYLDLSKEEKQDFLKKEEIHPKPISLEDMKLALGELNYNNKD